MKLVTRCVMNTNAMGVIAFGVVLCLLAGCSTIQFVQLEQSVDAPTVDRWHHSTLNGMVEISKPLDVRSICGDKAWTTITTEFTFLNALPVILVPSTPLISFYSAWTNRVNCYTVINTNDAPLGNPSDAGKH
ncbi:hypothetical protein NBRC116583_12030 [Arenicella sp. 4NH20-0111]|uniref:Bor/Iss family lipoprotein n=1 Tax=Arenicella sp. 4NH20-0111 TaxID=3127648 RepID=UPI003101C8B9